mgnify:CR=1 FL=1
MHTGCPKAEALTVAARHPTKGKEKGTGLGLMLCKTLVARNNGKLSFFTEENIGTTFSILLPVDNQNRKVKTQ